VISFSVARRTREVGIRMALGAQRRDIFVLIVQRVTLLVCAGLAVGSVIALASSRALVGLLFGIKPADPAVFAGATLMLLTAAAVAACLPARRALQVNPSTALRHE
jgi:ABC-type antimicrobial peptide transport system permease subunit